MALNPEKRNKESRRGRYLVTCPRGLEDLLLAELREVGVQPLRGGVGGLRFEGGMDAAYRVAVWSRVASRVIRLLADVEAPDAATLHARVADLPWERHFHAGATLAVDFSGTSDALRNTLFSARVIKDGIVDRLRSLRGERPGVDLTEPGVRITARLHRDRVSLGVDLSGPMHRRGYRAATGAAPLRENLAAAVLMRAGWPAMAAQRRPFHDPLCGSGTFLMEAALIAAGAAPGERRAPGSPQWSGHEPHVLEAILEDARSRRERGLARLPDISGADADPRVLEHARDCARAWGLPQLVFERRAIGSGGEAERLAGAPGLLACNPPWGERMGAGPELRELYAALGRFIRQSADGWRAAILVADTAPVSDLQLRIDREYGLRNGSVDCRLIIHDPDGRAARRSEQRAAPSAGRASDAPRSPPALGAEPSPEGVAMLANRLRKNLRRLRAWIARGETDCYRVYDADIPEYAVAVDRYADWLHVAEYAPPASIDPERARARLADVLAAIQEVFGTPAEQIVLKRRERQRGERQYERLGAGAAMLQVREGDARLLVNLQNYLDTGLFLDHRPARRLIASLAPGRRFLNLFCYTGSASVSAALGGARSTTSIDMSATYLDWARRNLELNGFAEPAHRCERADCLRWLAEPRAAWDLVFLDPPSFSNSARMTATLDVQRDHVQLLRDALGQLAPGGVLLFSTNRRGFRLDEAALQDLRVEDLSESSVDPDFPRRPLPHRLFRIERAT